jgi:hypothetical protein
MMMGLNRREIILAAITGVLLAILAARVAVSELFGMGRQLRQLRNNLHQQVERLEGRLARVKKLEAQLEEFKARSLPSNTGLARSLYGNWLLETAKEAGWQNTFLDIGESRAVGAYQSLRFTLKADANWEGIARFLYKFYSTDFFHRVRLLALQPKEKSQLIEINISVEAISLGDSLNRDSLPNRPPKNLAAGDAHVYTRTLAQRNLFGPYSPQPAPERRPPVVSTPPPPPSPPPPPPFDPSRFAFLTGIVGPPGQLEAWVLSRTEGRLYVLREGAEFQIGLLRGRLRRLELRSAEVEAEGRRWRVNLGETLRPQMLSGSSTGEVGASPPPQGAPLYREPPESPAIPTQISEEAGSPSHTAG